MKIEYKVIALSIIIGLLVWVIDAVVDYFYFLSRAIPERADS